MLKIIALKNNFFALFDRLGEIQATPKMGFIYLLVLDNHLRSLK